MQRPIVSISWVLVVKALRKYLKLEANAHVDLRTIAADKIENALWDEQLIPTDFRYSSYNPLTCKYLFVLNSDRMSETYFAEFAEKVSLMPGVEITSYTSKEKPIHGLVELLNSVRELTAGLGINGDSNNSSNT